MGGKGVRGKGRHVRRKSQGKKKKEGRRGDEKGQGKEKERKGEDTTTQVTASFWEIGNRPSSRKCLVTHNGFTLEFECNH